MKTSLKVFKSAVIFTLLIVLYGCSSFDFLGIGKVVKPEEIKHYEPQGVLVAVTVDCSHFLLASYVQLQLYDTSSFSIYTPLENNYIILDVSYKCTGISRTGMIYDTQLPEEWFDNSCRFRLESNKVNYLGRFAFVQNAMLITARDKMTVTNTLEKDIKWFLEYYPTLSNTEFISVPVTNGSFFVQ